MRSRSSGAEWVGSGWLGAQSTRADSFSISVSLSDTISLVNHHYLAKTNDPALTRYDID
jgi:hypothetical protein